MVTELSSREKNFSDDSTLQVLHRLALTIDDHRAARDGGTLQFRKDPLWLLHDLGSLAKSSNTAATASFAEFLMHGTVVRY